DGPVSVAAKQRFQFVGGNAIQHSRIGNLVAVQVQDRENRAVDVRVEELVGVPAGGERPGLCFAVADHTGHDQVGVVEGGTVGVDERVAEFTALVNRPWSLRGDVTGDTSGKRELPEQFSKPLRVLLNTGIHLAVGALQIRVSDQAGTAVTRSSDVDDVGVAFSDDSVQVGVDEVEAGCRTPVPQQPGLDVLDRQRLHQQRVVQQVDLTDRQVIRCPPISVEQIQLIL